MSNFSLTLNVHRPHLPMSCGNDAQCLLNTVANVFPTLLPRSSSSSCPSSRKTVPRVFRVLLPVSCSASCPCIPSPLARYHSAPMLVITLFSRSSSLRSHARVFWGGLFQGMNGDVSEENLKTFRSKERRIPLHEGGKEQFVTFLIRYETGECADMGFSAYLCGVH